MKAAWSSAPPAPSHSFRITLAMLLGIGTTTGWGSSGPPTPPEFSGNTSVTVLLASTANDQVTRFAVELQTLTLTSQSGKTVTLLSSQQPIEFKHLNGGIEPLATVTTPQDVYTSATVTTPQASSAVAVQGVTRRVRRDVGGLVLQTVTTIK